MPKKPNRQITTVTAPSVCTLVRMVKIEKTDTTAFEAFVLPKNAVVSGVYVLGNTNANTATTAVISVGTNPGTSMEILNNWDLLTKGDGYFAAGSDAGNALGKQLTADTKYYAKYLESGGVNTSTDPWYVKVEYYIPQQGESY